MTALNFESEDSEETKEDTTKEIFEKFPTIEEPWAKMEKNASNPELSSPPDKKHGNKTKEDTKEGDGEIIKTLRNKYSLNIHYIYYLMNLYECCIKQLERNIFEIKRSLT